MEALAPVLVDDLALVLDELPAGAHVVVCDPERVRTRAADLVRTSQEFLDASWAVAAGGGKAPVDLAAASLRRLRRRRSPRRAAKGLPWWGITALREDESVVERIRRGAGLPRRHRGRDDRSASRGRATGWRVALVFDGHGTAQRAVERLARRRRARRGSSPTPRPTPASST